jgi:chromate transporter
VPASWDRTPSRFRWALYLLAGGAAAATIGPWLVLVLLACGAIELVVQRGMPGSGALSIAPLVWVAFKVGALAYGGGFVIIPLMQADAVSRYHWLTAGQFLNAVALGQITPGPVVQTVAVVGYGAAGVGGAFLAAAVAFTPSFAFVLLGGNRFDLMRRNAGARAFLGGAGPAAIGAILGSAVLLVLRRGVVPTLLLAGAVGVIVTLGR